MCIYIVYLSGQCGLGRCKHSLLPLRVWSKGSYIDNYESLKYFQTFSSQIDINLEGRCQWARKEMSYYKSSIKRINKQMQVTIIEKFLQKQDEVKRSISEIIPSQKETQYLNKESSVAMRLDFPDYQSKGDIYILVQKLLNRLIALECQFQN